MNCNRNQIKTSADNAVFTDDYCEKRVRAFICENNAKDFMQRPKWQHKTQGTNCSISYISFRQGIILHKQTQSMKKSHICSGVFHAYNPRFTLCFALQTVQGPVS